MSDFCMGNTMNIKITTYLILCLVFLFHSIGHGDHTFHSIYAQPNLISLSYYGLNKKKKLENQMSEGFSTHARL